MQNAQAYRINLGDAWSHPQVVQFYQNHRNKSTDVYRGEWVFLKPLLREGMSVLDIGCALGGFAEVIAEHVKQFHYVGVDVSHAMIENARARLPSRTFYHLAEGDFSKLDGQTFDLVICLGILHLHESWRDTLAKAWKHTGKHLLFDLRESHLPTLEDPTQSFLRMDVYGNEGGHRDVRLPYIVVNYAEAMSLVLETCVPASSTSQFGYIHAAHNAARGLPAKVMMNTWCIEKESKND